MTPEARLLVVQGTDQGRRFEVGRSPVHIGRGVQNEIRILDTEVSRRHATLGCQENVWWIADEGSSNGTFVNGRAVSRERLRTGDQVQVGRTILLFTEGGLNSESVLPSKIDLTVEPSDASQIISALDSVAAQPLARRAAIGADRFGKPDENLEVLYRITEEVVRPSASFDLLLKRIMDLTLDAVNADRGVLFLFDSRTDRIEPRVVCVRSGRAVSDRFPVSQTIVEYVIQHGQGIQTTDAQHDARFEEGQSILQAGIREVLCVPVQGRYELLGVIYVDTVVSPAELADSQARSRFSTDQLALLLAIGRQSALAVENNRYQEALVAAERLAAVGQTISMLGHDIKNILQGMRGGSYLVDQGLSQQDVELARKGWTILERSQDRIFNLVMDMLSYSKDRPPRLRMADVNSTVREVCELLRTRAEDQQTELNLVTDPQLPRSLFDEDAIHRAVLNVVTNALDALEHTPGGLVTVSTRFDEPDQRLLIEVADNGPGIPPEEKPNLFNLFVSGKGAKGTGLGLAVCRKVLREHGGDVEVQSEVGAGATFRLWWPFHEDDAEGSSVSRSPAVSGSPTQAG